MKKFIISVFALIVLFVPATIFASSCDSEGEGFFIKFTLEEQEYILTFGFTDVGTGDPYVVLFPGVTNGDLISIFGSTVESDSSVVREDLDNVIDVRGRLYPHTQGVYEDDYDAAGNTINSYGELGIHISENSVVYLYSSTSGIITITSFGAEGEAVEGTFDITFEGGIAPASIGDSPLAVTGEFRLKRVSWEDIPYYPTDRTH